MYRPCGSPQAAPMVHVRVYAGNSCSWGEARPVRMPGTVHRDRGRQSEEQPHRWRKKTTKTTPRRGSGCAIHGALAGLYLTLTAEHPQSKHGHKSRAISAVGIRTEYLTLGAVLDAVTGRSPARVHRLRRCRHAEQCVNPRTRLALAVVVERMWHLRQIG